MKSFSGKQIFLLFSKSTSGKTYRHFEGNIIYLINEDTYNFCKEGKIKDLSFEDTTQTLESEGRDPLKVWRPKDISFSNNVTIAEQIETTELQIKLKKVTKELEAA